MNDLIHFHRPTLQCVFDLFCILNLKWYRTDFVNCICIESNYRLWFSKHLAGGLKESTRDAVLYHNVWSTKHRRPISYPLSYHEIYTCKWHLRTYFNVLLLIFLEPFFGMCCYFAKSLEYIFFVINNNLGRRLLRDFIYLKVLKLQEKDIVWWVSIRVIALKKNTQM